MEREMIMYRGCITHGHVKVEALPSHCGNDECESCNFWVNGFDESVLLEVDDNEGKAYGDYCRACADNAIKEGWAREVKK